MNKIILIFLLLFSFVISVETQCQSYEIYDEENNKCVKACEEHQFFNQDEGSCEDLCEKGQIFNLTTSSCWTNMPNDHKEVGKPEQQNEETNDENNEEGGDQDEGGD